MLTARLRLLLLLLLLLPLPLRAIPPLHGNHVEEAELQAFGDVPVAIHTVAHGAHVSHDDIAVQVTIDARCVDEACHRRVNTAYMLHHVPHGTISFHQLALDCFLPLVCASRNIVTLHQRGGLDHQTFVFIGRFGEVVDVHSAGQHAPVVVEVRVVAVRVPGVRVIVVVVVVVDVRVVVRVVVRVGEGQVVDV
ncbi:hypothetical protein QBC39DRAFT_356063 [Podospora conica]|nr:hypothetical protein QBC39DRAFT_356063 [Schizothecium conicum]